MKTPAGQECRYYYEDFHRGRNVQECRLIGPASGAKRWHPTDCASCPVPGILWSNASRYLELSAEVRPGILGFGRRVEVEAWCSKHDIPIPDPHIGCPACNKERADLSVFFDGENNE